MVESFIWAHKHEIWCDSADSGGANGGSWYLKTNSSGLMELISRVKALYQAEGEDNGTSSRSFHVIHYQGTLVAHTVVQISMGVNIS